MPFPGGAGGSPQGSLRWIAQLDVTQFKQGTATLKNEMTGVGSTAKTTAQSFAPITQQANAAGAAMGNVQKSTVTMNSAFTAGLTPIKNQGSALSQLVTTQGKLIQSNTQTGTSFSKVGGFMKNNLTQVGLLSAGIAGLDDQFINLHKAQVAVARVSVMNERAANRLSDFQRKVNQMIAEGKEGTVEYNALLEDMAIAEDQAAVAKQRAEVAQEALNERTEDFWVNILPNLIFVGTSATSLLQNLGLNGQRLRGILPGMKAGVLGLAGGFGTLVTHLKDISFKGLASGFLSLGAPILTVIGGVWLLIGAIQAFNNINALFQKALGATSEEGIPLYKAAWLDLKKTLPSIFGELTAEEKKLMDNYKKTPEEIGITNEAIKREMIRGFTELNLPPEVEKKIKGMFEGLLNLTTAKDVFAEGMDDLQMTVNTEVENLGSDIEVGWTDMLKRLPGQISPQIDQFVASMDDSVKDSITKRKAERDKVAEEWARQQIFSLDAAAIGDLFRGRDAARDVGRAMEEMLTFAGNEADTKKATDPLIQKMKGDVEAGILDEVSPLMAESITKALDNAGIQASKQAPVMSAELTGALNQVLKATGENANFEQFRKDVIEGIRDPELKAKVLEQYNDLKGSVQEGIRDVGAAAKAAWETARSNLLGKIDEAQSNLGQVFNIKIDQNKITKKILDYIPDNLVKKMKIDVKTDLNLKGAKQGIMDSIYGALATPEIRNNDEKLDEFVNGIIKYLAEKFPDSPWSKTAQAELAAAVAGDNTKEEVAKLMEKWEAAPIPITIDEATLNNLSTVIVEALHGQTYEVPITGKIGGILYGGGSGKTTVSGFAEAEGSLVKGGSTAGMLTSEPVGTVPLSGSITKITSQVGDISEANPLVVPAKLQFVSTIPYEPFPSNDVKGGEGGVDEKGRPVDRYGNVIKDKTPPEVAVAKIDITGATRLITRLIDNYAGYVKFVNTQTPVAKVDITSATKLITRLIGNFGGYVSQVNKSEPKAQIDITGATKLITRLIGNFMGYVKKVNTTEPVIRIDNEQALDKIQDVIDKLAKIKDKSNTVTTTYVEKRGEGGILSYAKGGIVAKASGGKRLVMIGDNPGGDEILAAFPKNDPWPTMQSVLSYIQQGTQTNPAGTGGGGGGRMLSQPINVNLTNVVYDYEIQRRYSMRQGAHQGQY